MGFSRSLHFPRSLLQKPDLVDKWKLSQLAVESNRNVTFRHSYSRHCTTYLHLLHWFCLYHLCILSLLYAHPIIYCTVHLYSEITAEIKALLDSSWLHKYNPSSQVTDIPLTERQMFKDDHLSTSQRFFSLPFGIGPNDRRLPFLVAVQATIFLPCNSVQTNILCVHRRVCYPQSYSGRRDK